MIKNEQSLRDKAKNLAKENNISMQEVLQNYFFERILERLSKSKYKNNFIIKGRNASIINYGYWFKDNNGYGYNNSWHWDEPRRTKKN